MEAQAGLTRWISEDLEEEVQVQAGVQAVQTFPYSMRFLDSKKIWNPIVWCPNPSASLGVNGSNE